MDPSAQRDTHALCPDSPPTRPSPHPTRPHRVEPLSLLNTTLRRAASEPHAGGTSPQRIWSSTGAGTRAPLASESLVSRSRLATHAGASPERKRRTCRPAPVKPQILDTTKAPAPPSRRWRALLRCGDQRGPRTAETMPSTRPRTAPITVSPPSGGQSPGRGGPAVTRPPGRDPTGGRLRGSSVRADRLDVPNSGGWFVLAAAFVFAYQVGDRIVGGVGVRGRWRETASLMVRHGGLAAPVAESDGVTETAEVRLVRVRHSRINSPVSQRLFSNRLPGRAGS